MLYRLIIARLRCARGGPDKLETWSHGLSVCSLDVDLVCMRQNVTMRVVLRMAIEFFGVLDT